MNLTILGPALALGWILLAPQSARAQATMPFFEGFENTSGEIYTADTPSLIGAPEWSFTHSDPSGRLRMAAGTGFPRTGNAAATLDRNPSGTNQINFLFLNLNMSSFTVANDTIVLDFSFTHHGEESNPNDRVWVRGSSADTFVEVVNLNALQGPAGTYVDLADIDISAALATAGQDYSSTFQIRFGQEDNFPATSTTVSDGYTFDDIALRRLSNVDIEVVDIIAPSDRLCGTATQDVTVVVANRAVLPASNIPITVNVTGDVTDTLMGVIPGPIEPEEVATFTVGTIDTFNGGDVTLTAINGIANDEVANNDQFATSVSVTGVPVATLPAEATCPSNPAIVSVVPEPGTTFNWFDVETGGTLLGSGAVFETPPVDEPTTFWVERGAAPEFMGPPDNTFGDGAQHTMLDDGLVFDVTENTIIRAVHVFPREAGEVTVRIRDIAGTTIGVKTVEVTTPDVKTQLPLNIAVPAGNGYRISAEGSTTALFRNSSGAAYPYDGSVVSITGSINGLSNFYYFFYDWLVDGEACNEQRTPVFVDTDPAICSVDLGVEVEAPERVVAGTEATFRIRVTNQGIHAAAGVELDAPIPEGTTFVRNAGACITEFPCDLGVIRGGGQRFVLMTVLVGPDYDPGTDVSGAVTVSSSSNDTAPGNESAQAGQTVDAEVDLQLDMIAQFDPALAEGGGVKYAITVINNGPSSARNTVIRVDLPAGTELRESAGCNNDPGGAPMCELGTVAPDSIRDVVLTVETNNAGSVTTSATVESSTPDTVEGNESATVTVMVAEGGGCRASGDGAGTGHALLLLLALGLVARRRRR